MIEFDLLSKNNSELLHRYYACTRFEILFVTINTRNGVEHVVNLKFSQQKVRQAVPIHVPARAFDLLNAGALSECKNMIMIESMKNPAPDMDVDKMRILQAKNKMYKEKLMSFLHKKLDPRSKYRYPFNENLIDSPTYPINCYRLYIKLLKEDDKNEFSQVALENGIVKWFEIEVFRGHVPSKIEYLIPLVKTKVSVTIFIWLLKLVSRIHDSYIIYYFKLIS